MAENNIPVQSPDNTNVAAQEPVQKQEGVSKRDNWHPTTFDEVYTPERAEAYGIDVDMDDNESKFKYLEQNGFWQLRDGRWWNPDTNTVIDEFMDKLVDNQDRYGKHTEDFLQKLADKYKPRRITKTVTPINRAMPVQDAYDAEGGSHRTDREPEE